MQSNKLTFMHFVLNEHRIHQHWYVSLKWYIELLKCLRDHSNYYIFFGIYYFLIFV